MKINATMGVKSLKYGVIQDGQSTAIASTAVSDVYQDTCTFVTKDPTTTEHKSETSKKRIILQTKEPHDLVFSIMDPTPEEMAAFMGGTNHTSGSGASAVVDGFTESEDAEQINMSFEITPVAGLKLKIPSASVSAKINSTFSAKGITLLEVTATTTSAITYGEESSAS